jgi:protein AIR1/2
MSVHEVIDLTTESPDQLASNALDPSTLDGRKLKRKKKPSNSKSGTPEEVPSTLNDSNERNAKLDRSSKRKRIHETSKNERRSQAHKRDSGEPDKSDSAADLFFVDLSPTAIIPSLLPVSKESISTTNGENEKVPKLLLPSHVTVFGDALVEIISQPLSDSDDDEFIKYLDYEDTRVCTHYSFAFLGVHSIVFLRMYCDITMNHLTKEPPLTGLFAKIAEQKESIRLLLVLYRL